MFSALKLNHKACAGAALGLPDVAAKLRAVRERRDCGTSGFVFERRPGRKPLSRVIAAAQGRRIAE